MAENLEALVGQVLAAYRHPLHYQKQLRGPVPVPFQPVLQLAAGKREAEVSAWCRRWQSTPEELRQAAVFFVEQVCLQGDEDHPYRILGLAPGAELRQIQAHYHLLMLLFHPDRIGTTVNWREGYAARINQAYQQLRRTAGRQSRTQAVGQQNGAHKEASVPAPRKRRGRIVRGRRRSSQKRGLLFYLVRRFPRLTRHLPHVILGGGIALTVGLVASFYFTRIAVDRPPAPVPEAPAAAPPPGKESQAPSPPPRQEVRPRIEAKDPDSLHSRESVLQRIGIEQQRLSPFIQE